MRSFFNNHLGPDPGDRESSSGGSIVERGEGSGAEVDVVETGATSASSRRYRFGQITYDW
jgi:hypothetical protein